MQHSLWSSMSSLSERRFQMYEELLWREDLFSSDAFPTPESSQQRDKQAYAHTLTTRDD